MALTNSTGCPHGGDRRRPFRRDGRDSAASLMPRVPQAPCRHAVQPWTASGESPYGMVDQ
jgi:hypothetical protein